MNIFSKEPETMIRRYAMFTLLSFVMIMLNTISVLYNEYGEYGFYDFKISDVGIAAKKEGLVNELLIVFILFQAMSCVRFFHILKEHFRFVSFPFKLCAYFSIGVFAFSCTVLGGMLGAVLLFAIFILLVWMLFFRAKNNIGEE